jgi:uncharacterized protein
MPRLRYGPHARFVDPARAMSAPHLLLIGVLIVETVYLASAYLIDPFLRWIPLADPTEVARGDTPRGLIVQLSSFVILGLAVVYVSRRLHGRGFASLIGPSALALRDLLRVSLFLGAMVLVLEFMTPDPDLLSYAEMRPLPQWLALLPLALAALLIQTGAEELFYRGYVQQQLAARFTQTWVWMVLPSLLFASAHYRPDLPPIEALQYLIWAFFFGLAAADLTARSGTLGPAIGFHLVNNAMAFLMYGEAGAVDSGLALFLFPAIPMGEAMSLPEMLPPDHGMAEWLISPGFVVELVGIGLLWIGARLAIRR